MAPKQEPLPRPDRWHIGKEIPLALIFAMVFQIGMFVWALAGLSERVTQLEKQISGIGSQTERLIRLETRFEAVRDVLTEIKNIVSETRPTKPALTR